MWVFNASIQETTKIHMKESHMWESKSEHNKTRICSHITSTYVGKLPLPFDNALPKNSSKIEIELSFITEPLFFDMPCFSMEYLSTASVSQSSVPFRILEANSVEELMPPDGRVCFWCTPMLSEMPFSFLLLAVVSVTDRYPSTWPPSCAIVGNLSSLAGMWAYKEQKNNWGTVWHWQMVVYCYHILLQRWQLESNSVIPFILMNASI